MLVGSAIAPSLAAAACGVIEDTGFWEPNRELGLEVRVNYKKNPPHSFGALLAFYQEDGDLWQGKPLNPWADAKYVAPTGVGNRIYLPPVDVETRQRISEVYGVEVPLEGSFWEWLAAHPELAIVFTEGGKKALALLSHGIIAISFYGCHGYGRVKLANGAKGAPYLRDDVLRFAVAGRQVSIAFDKDEKPTTVLKVAQATATMAQLLQAQGCTVTTTHWEPSLGKGVDDLIAAHGIDAYLAAAEQRLGKTAIAKIEADVKRDKRQRQRANQDRQWLDAVAKATGLPEGMHRRGLVAAWDDLHKLTGPVVEGYFPSLELPQEGQRRLTVLDGTKGTGKTVAIASLVKAAYVLGLSMVIFCPTKLLAKATASRKEFAGYNVMTLEKYLATDPVYRRANAIILCCPESAHKLAGMNFDVVGLDEVNENVPRAQSGILGKFPKESRDQVMRLLGACQMAVIANEGVYRPALAAVQRWGKFSPEQVEVIRRMRPKTQMTIKLYLDEPGEGESWDGASEVKPTPTPGRFTWFDGMAKATAAGETLIAPYGSQGQARIGDRVLRAAYPDAKSQVIDGQYTPGIRPDSTRQAFTASPHTFSKDRGHQRFIYTPTLGSGLSLDQDKCSYYQHQFECIRTFETASEASQRGERYRHALGGGILSERHVYISQRGLPRHPDPSVFTADYYRQVLTTPENHEVLNMAVQLGASEIMARLNPDSPEDWLELPELLAIQARETYFKLDFLEMEWQSYGWQVERVAPDPAAAKRWSEQFYQVKEGIIAQRSNILAKARATRPGEDEPEGPIEAAKNLKWAICDLLNNYTGIKDPAFWESWVIAAPQSLLQSLQVRSLVNMAHSAPEQFQQIGQLFALAAVARADRRKNLPTLPCSERVWDTAKLLATAPHLQEFCDGTLPEWNKETPQVVAVATWTRKNAIALARLSSHNQRIHGLAFTDKTPDVKCLHKLLAMVGLTAQCGGQRATGRYWYRLQVDDDVRGKLARREAKALADGTLPHTHELERELHRLTTGPAVFSAVDQAIASKLTSGANDWAALKDSLSAHNRTSEYGSLITEVVLPPQKPTARHRRHGWLATLQEVGADGFWKITREDGSLATVGADDWEVVA